MLQSFKLSGELLTDKNCQLPVAEDLPRSRESPSTIAVGLSMRWKQGIISEALKMSYDFIIVVVITITITTICVVLSKRMSHVTEIELKVLDRTPKNVTLKHN